MPDRRTLLLTVLAMLAFAGNSLLCRAALKDTAIDAVSFTALRLFSGALMLAVLLHLRRRPATPARGGWRGAAALFVYQQRLIRGRQREACFQAFLNNNYVGALVLLGVMVHYL